MPYSLPAQGRATHRRSFSNIVPPPSLASTNTTGAFASLGALPTRRRSSRPTFQLGKEDDDDSQDESPDEPRPTKLTINTNLHHDDEHAHLPPLRLKSKFASSFDDPTTTAVPFPRSSPLPSPTLPHSPSVLRPSVSRTSSTPILLANGKPLKSSLKSSSSSPNIPFPPQSLVPSIMFPQLHQHHHHHQRACSAPATPNLELDPQSSPNSPSPSPSPLPQSSSSPAPSSPTTHHKNVHFPSQEEGGLTTVRVYKRSAKPASLLRKGEETETETEGESSSAPNPFNLPFVWGSRWSSSNQHHARAPGYPFGGGAPKKPSPLADRDLERRRLEIDIKNSSPIPARGAEQSTGNVHFETLGFVSEPGSDKLAKPLTLTGTVLVRNISYHKTVVVRYTLDDWNTTNDVLARHEKSLAALPERFLLASLPLIEDPTGGLPESGKREVVCRPCAFENDLVVEVGGVPSWDRFRFDVSLERYESSIEERTMWFVGKYATAPVDVVVPGGEKEWWDNNSGNNYRVAFVRKEVSSSPVEEEVYRRNVVFSAPPVFTPSKPFPAPPQISASLSYPSMTTSSSSSSARREHAAASHAALTQRLKKFSFTNYSAPSPVVVSPPPVYDDVASSSSSGTTTANTSTDSTPVQTPKEEDNDEHEESRKKSFRFGGKVAFHDVNANVLVHDDDRWGLSAGNLQMRDGHPATFVPPVVEEEHVDVPLLTVTVTDDERTPTTIVEAPSASSTPTPIPTTNAKPMEIAPSSKPVSTLSPPTGLNLPDGVVEMGTSPPFSMLAGMEMRNGMFASMERKRDLGLYWPWGGEASAAAMATPPPLTTTSTTTLPSIVAPTPTTTPTSTILPQRKKVHHHHSQSLAVPNNNNKTFSIGRPSSSSSSRSASGSSGSGSGSDTAVKPRSSTVVAPQPWPLSPQTQTQTQNQLRRVMSPPPVLGSRRIFELKPEDDDVDDEDPPVPSTPPTSPRISEPEQQQQIIPNSTATANDAVYQAFVRQWCFAQGPAPANLGVGEGTTGAGTGAGAGTTRMPDVVVR